MGAETSQVAVNVRVLHHVVGWTRPPGVAYQVTAKGETALRFLDELRRWSEDELGLTYDQAADDETE